MTERILETPEDLELWIKFLRSRKLPQTASTRDGRDRSDQQNKIMWLWAAECAEQFGDRTHTEVQREWKLRFGVPILRRDSAEFRATYDSILKPLPYPAKLALMAFMPVTSELKVRQMVEFLDTIQREAAEHGVRLTDPDPDLAKYQQRNRMKAAA